MSQKLTWAEEKSSSQYMCMLGYYTLPNLSLVSTLKYFILMNSMTNLSIKRGLHECMNGDNKENNI